METTKKLMEELEQLIEEESKTIANIEVNIVDSKNILIESYNQCDFCGSELIFAHNTNFISQEVIEEAFCPGCNLPGTSQSHKLQ
jgi:hypothetical protein